MPEVETIKEQLNQKIKGKTVKTVEVNLERFVKYPLDDFKKIVEGSIIENISRRAKLLIFGLSSGYCLIVHLKLSGQLIFNGEKQKHTHLVYYFKDGSWLIHNDLRQFGFVKVVSKQKLLHFLEEEKLGPEPLGREFTLDLFKELLQKRKRSPIKKVLMDPKFVAGIGNLYADEILFFAGVRPTRKVFEITKEEIEKIYRQIKRILALAVKKGGSSSSDYVDAEGEEGDYLSLVKVYQRDSQPCKKCKTEIERVKINNRSAHYCPNCQK